MDLIPALVRANQAILRQKVGLLNTLIHQYGPTEAQSLFQTKCPIVQASVGQHVRHSMDHIEFATAAAAAAEASSHSMTTQIHYDRRSRGGTEETDLDASLQRIRHVDTELEHLMQHRNRELVFDQTPVEACFVLSGDNDIEYQLPSTVARELGFAAHHAIHHMALIRIIALNTWQVKDIPHDFGRAPATIHHDQQRTENLHM